MLMCQANIVVSFIQQEPDVTKKDGIFTSKDLLQTPDLSHCFHFLEDGLSIAWNHHMAMGQCQKTLSLFLLGLKMLSPMVWLLPYLCILVFAGPTLVYMILWAFHGSTAFKNWHKLSRNSLRPLLFARPFVKVLQTFCRRCILLSRVHDGWEVVLFAFAKVLKLRICIIPQWVPISRFLAFLKNMEIGDPGYGCVVSH